MRTSTHVRKEAKKTRTATRVRKKLNKVQLPRRIEIRTAAVFMNTNICSAFLGTRESLSFLMVKTPAVLANINICSASMWTRKSLSSQMLQAPEDLEKACDEKVEKKEGGGGRKEERLTGSGVKERLTSMEGEQQPRYEEIAALESENEIVTYTGVASCKDEENKEAKMKENEDVKEEEKARRERTKEA